jgi:hypothetical protein
MEAAVIGEVDRFIGSAPIADDLTLLLLRWNGPEHDRAGRNVPSA